MVNLIMTIDEEIQQAIGIMRKLTAKAYGSNWYAIYEELPEDTILVGVEAEDETLVCDGDNFSDEDAEFISMMDPTMAQLVISFLESALEQDAKQKHKGYLHGRSSAWRIAHHVNTKFGKEQYGVPTSRRR